MVGSENGAETSIIFRRPRGGWADRLRPYGVSVDGHQIGKLRPGDRIVLAVPPGKRTVRAHIDWTGSPAVQVEVADKEQVELCVRPSGGLYRLDRYFGTSRYLTIERLVCPLFGGGGLLDSRAT